MLAQDQFQNAITLLGGWDATALHARLVEAWAEPTRRYHTHQHLAECLELAERWGAAGAPLDYARLVLAIWYHDAVYNPQGKDNEALSAELARDELASVGIPQNDCERIAQMVMATAHGTPVAAGDPVIDMLLDIDLAILGASPARFAEYQDQVREEYRWVDDAAYAVGRGKVLAHFEALANSDPQTLYRTPEGASLLAQARINLEKSKI